MNPFNDDVCADPLAVAEERSVAAMNRDVVSRVGEAIDERQRSAGKTGGHPLMLLTAPRAGYGKTHLLGRVAAATGNQMTLVPLAFRIDDEIGFCSIGLRGAEALTRAPGSRSGWSRLRESCAGVVSTLLLRLIQGGKLPCANPEQAIRVLSSDVAEIFSDTGSARLIGDWLKKHFTQLRKPLADSAVENIGGSASDAERWLQAMLTAASEGDSRAEGAVRALASESRGMCEMWLRLLSIWRPVVVLVDHLDGYYRNEQAGLRIAMLLLDLSEVEGVHVVLSLNQDVWQATFGHHLPSALEDRLTASQVLLRGLTAEDAQELVRLRLQIARVGEDDAAKFLRFLDVRRFFLGRPLGSVSARVFLRHVAQQWSAFANAPESDAPSTLIDESDSVLPVIEEKSAIAPLPAPVPSNEITVFDSSTTDYVKRVAEGLAEPVAALPQQDIAPLPVPDSSAAISSAPTLSAATSARSAGAFEKLREMLDKLRHADGATNGNGSASATPPPPVAAPAADRPSAPLTTSSFSRDALLGRFEALRLQMSAEAESRQLDLTRVAELVRLAGKRFPLVHFSEVELPGMTSRTAAKWVLQGSEILFGLAEFQDRRYWQTLGLFAAGRQAEISDAAARTGDAAPQFKIVAFKTDRDTQGWTELNRDEIFPSMIRENVDAVHLDTRSISALYAMQRMIKEAAAGTIQAEPAQVMSVLARELDFFWKRITRPLAMAK